MTKVLCLDDDPNILAAHERNLRKHFHIETVLTGELGLKALQEEGPFSVILVDMRMPGMDGIQFLKRAQEISPDTIRVMLTGNNDQQTAIHAVNEGHVFRFISKPCSSEILIQTLTAAVRQYELVTAERQLLEGTLHGSVKLLTDVLSLSDPIGFGKAQNLKEYCRDYLSSPGHSAYSHQKNLAPSDTNEAWEIELAAMLLNLGCVTIPSHVLVKARTKLVLAEEEAALVERLPEIGSNLLANIPRLQNVAKIVLYQNKYFDGSGYPKDRVRGVEIPFGCRLIRILSDLLELESTGLNRHHCFDKLQKSQHLYDSEILQVVSKFLLPQDGPTIKVIALRELLIHDLLLSSLKTKEGVLLIPTGTEISNFILHKIQNFRSLRVLEESLQVRISRIADKP